MAEKSGRWHPYRYKQNLPQQLRALYYVSRTGSFTQAAEMMGLEQPTVSVQIAALEHEFKAKLIERARGSVSLTPEGETLLKLATPIVECLESVKQEFDEQLGRMEEGRVLCAAGEGISTYILPKIVGKFWQLYPRIEVNLVTVGSLSSVSLVARGEVDLAIPAVASDPEGMVSVTLSPCHVFIVAPHGHPLARTGVVDARSLADYPLIAPVEDSAIWQATRNWLAKAGMASQPALRVNSPEARLRCVEKGMGITVIQGLCRLSPAAKDVAWLPLAGHLPDLKYALIYRQNVYLPTAARRFADFVVEHWPSSGT